MDTRRPAPAKAWGGHDNLFVDPAAYQTKTVPGVHQWNRNLVIFLWTILPKWRLVWRFQAVTLPNHP